MQYEHENPWQELDPWDTSSCVDSDDAFKEGDIGDPDQTTTSNETDPPVNGGNGNGSCGP